MTPQETRGALLVISIRGADPAWAAPRLRLELTAADVLVCSAPDTAYRLAEALGVAIAGDIVSPGDLDRSTLTAAVSSGRRVVVMVDGSIPEDPASALVADALAWGLAVRSAPGPSPHVAALAVSGLPTDRFVVGGELPADSVRRLERLSELRAETATLVLRVPAGERAAVLVDVAAALGVRPVRYVPDDPSHPGSEVPGTLVVGGADAVRLGRNDVRDAQADVRSLVAAGERLKDACRIVAARTGVPSRELYAAALAARAERPAP